MSGALVPVPGTLLGRAGEIGELVELVGRERLVTLTGAPGIGKTRLALEVAGELGGGYPGGARVVELAPIMDGALVPGAVASALSIPEVAGQSITDTLVAHLSERRMLVVLDNCEHVLDACAQLVDALFSGCPGIRILATSREPLALATQTVWQVPPLSVPEPAETSPSTLVGYAAVGLFVERAAAIQPGFALNAYLAPAVAEICRRLDGIPLAIELAAARVDSLTPEEIARRLEDRFGLLKTGSRGGLARHRTLRAALDWSHDLLSASERALLRRASVFVGGFGVEAAEAVCAGGEVESGEVVDLLARLVSKSLIVPDTDSPLDTRYRLLETIRVYAGERLEEAGETPSLRLSHARFYLGLAERAEPELTGPRQQDWLERLEAERANLRSAVEWSLSHGREDWALRLAGALVLYWRVRCHFSEGRELLDAAVSANGGTGPGLQAKALWGVGFMAVMMGDLSAAVPPLEECLTRFRALGDRKGRARGLLVLGSCRQFSDGSSGLALLEESATLAREAGDSWCLAHALALAGFIYSARVELSAAAPLFEECLVVAREAGDKQGLRFGLMGLGSVALHLGDLQLAESLLEEALTVTSELGEDYSKANALRRLGELAIQRGDFGRARELLDEAVSLIYELGDPLQLPGALALSGIVAQAEGDRGSARRLFEEALACADAGSNSRMAALLYMGRLAAEEGEVGASGRLFEEGLELARARSDKPATAQALYGLGELARAEGETKRAALLHDEALQLECEMGRVSGIVTSLEAVAGVAVACGRYEHAARLLGAAKAGREENRYTHAPWALSRYKADLALVREALSPEEFKAAYAQGAGLSIQQAAAQASKGGDPPRWLEGGWSSLTEREREVAALVAEGLTNPEIAERLFISRETVKRHLRHTFRKLGLAGRTELAREVWRREQAAVGNDR